MNLLALTINTKLLIVLFREVAFMQIRQIYALQQNSKELLFSKNYNKGCYCYLHTSNIQKDCCLTWL